MGSFVKKYLLVFLISMVPVIELRGAIPYGIGVQGLPILDTYIVAIIGNIVVVPFLVVFSEKILRRLAGFRKVGPFFQKIIDRAQAKAESKRFKRGSYAALFLFVAIPLPGTGAWTGSLIAALLQMDWKKAFLIISLGVVSAGVIMALLSAGIFGSFGASLSF